MKYSLGLAALVAYVSAQSVADLPSCSLVCMSSGVQDVGCSITDFACSCEKAAELTPKLTPCIQSACSDTADQEKVVQVLEGICASAGHPIEVPTPSAGGGDAPEPSASEPASSPSPSKAAPEPSAAAAEPTHEAPSEAPTHHESAITPSATEADHEPTATPAHSTGSSDDHDDDNDEKTCISTTVTVYQTGAKPTVPVSVPAPYPSSPGTGAPSVPAPSGTGAFTTSPPLFTGAAAAVRLPAGAAGLLGLAALFL